MGKNVAIKKRGASKAAVRNGEATRKARASRRAHFTAIEVKLNQQRQEILDLLRQDLGVGQSVSHEGDDDVDRANFDSNRELALALSTGEREVLLQISEALDRLDQGLYGSCSYCEKTIVEERLAAIPWARHCFVCQELEEKGLLDG